MAKIITPPQITSLDGLLELVLQPQKMVEYLQQMKDMRDGILQALEAYDTVEKANGFLAQATATKQAAQTASDFSTKMVEKAKNDMALLRSSLEKEKAAWATDKQKQQASLADRELAVQKLQSQVMAAEANLKQREGALQAQMAELLAKQTEVAAQKAKISQAHAALSAISAQG